MARSLDLRRYPEYTVADQTICEKAALTEFNDRGPVKWTLLLTQVAGLIAILSFTLHEAGLGFDQLKPISLFAGVAGMFSAFVTSRRATDSVDPRTRQQAIDRSIEQSSRGIPWYAAPVLWVPVVMLLTIWYFLSG